MRRRSVWAFDDYDDAKCKIARGPLVGKTLAQIRKLAKSRPKTTFWDEDDPNMAYWLMGENPGPDERLRRLERAAAAGDLEAQLALRHERARQGLEPEQRGHFLSSRHGPRFRQEWQAWYDDGYAEADHSEELWQYGSGSRPELGQDPSSDTFSGWNQMDNVITRTDARRAWKQGWDEHVGFTQGVESLDPEDHWEGEE